MVELDANPPYGYKSNRNPIKCGSVINFCSVLLFLVFRYLQEDLDGELDRGGSEPFPNSHTHYSRSPINMMSHHKYC